MSENLVVASKVKKMIKSKANMSTSTTAFDALTKIVEQEVEQAIQNAQRNNRKTVMDRDFQQAARF